MRTISAAQEELLTAPGRTTYLKVEVDSTGAGQLQDMGDLQGRNWIKGAKWGEQYENAVATAEVRLHREVYQLSLATLVAGSRFNATAKMLQIGRQLRISTAVSALGEVPAALDYVIEFDGYIDEIDWGGAESVVVLRCRDKGGLLSDRWVEEQKTYGTAAGRDMELVIQDILDAWPPSPAVTLSTPSSPAFKVVAYTQEQMSVMDAIQRLAQLAGWDVRYRWTGALFQLVLRQPTRTSPISARTFDADDYEDLTRVGIALSELRNVVQVVYASTERGTAQAGAGGSITLATTAVAVDSFYNGLRVRITAGTGSGQETGISGYTGATRVATVSPAWTTAPDATSVYEIVLSQASTTETGTAQAGGASTITLATSTSPTDDFYNDKFVVTITGGTGNGQRRAITDYVGSTKVATVGSAWTTNPDATSTYRVEVGDDASITKYGRRWMQLAQDFTGSQIDTPTEARDLAWAAVQDLAEPTVEHEVAGMPYFWPVQLDDYYTFNSNDVHYDAALLLGVVGYEHVLEEGTATTRLMLRGKPSIGVGRWMRAAAMPGLASTADRSGPATPSMIVGTAVGDGADGIVQVDFLLPRERDWSHSELHVSQSNPFTADGTTLKARGRGSFLQAVMGNGTWQARVIHVDREGNKSTASSQVQVVVPAASGGQAVDDENAVLAIRAFLGVG